MAAGDGGEGYLPEHFDGADRARSEHSALARCKYNLLASVLSERGPASVGPTAGEDSHRATNHIAGWIQEEKGDEKPRRASVAQEEMDGGET